MATDYTSPYSAWMFGLSEIWIGRRLLFGLDMMMQGRLLYDFGPTVSRDIFFIAINLFRLSGPIYEPCSTILTSSWTW